MTVLTLSIVIGFFVGKMVNKYQYNRKMRRTAGRRSLHPTY